MKVILWLVLVGLAFVANGHAHQALVGAFPADLSGTYASDGDAPNGAYTATTAILKHGEVYEVQWTFPRGDRMLGVGFVDGDRFVVGYDGGRAPGVIVYRVVADKPLTFEGRYVGWGFDKPYMERMVTGPAGTRAAR